MQTEPAPAAEDFTRRWSALLDEALTMMGVDPAAVTHQAGPFAELFRPLDDAQSMLRGGGADALIVDLSNLDPFPSVQVEDGPSYALRTGEDASLDSATISMRVADGMRAVASVEGYVRLDFAPPIAAIAVRGEFLCGALRKDAIGVAPTRSL